MVRKLSPEEERDAAVTAGALRDAPGKVAPQMVHGPEGGGGRTNPDHPSSPGFGAMKEEFAAAKDQMRRAAQLVPRVEALERDLKAAAGVIGALSTKLDELLELMKSATPTTTPPAPPKK